jgi:hypothetical protein
LKSIIRHGRPLTYDPFQGTREKGEEEKEGHKTSQKAAMIVSQGYYSAFCEAKLRRSTSEQLLRIHAMLYTLVTEIFTMHPNECYRSSLRIMGSLQRILYTCIVPRGGMASTVNDE